MSRDGEAAGDDLPVRVGERFTREIQFDADAIRSFARLVGDTNPLHHDQDFASRSRFGGLIASGTHTSALIMATVADHMTAKRSSVGLETACQFKRAVKAGTRLSVEWTVVSVEAKPHLDNHLVTLEGQAVDSAGIVYATAQAKLLILPA